MRLLAGGFGVCALLLAAQRPEPGADPEPGSASVAAIADALRAEKALGYDVRATSNGARLMAEVLLRLARTAHAADSLGPPFAVTAEAYTEAFIEVTGMSRDSLPLSVRIGRDYHEDVLVEHRRANVIAAVVEGPEPRFVIGVRGGWKDALPARYTYEDRSGSPALRVTHERQTSYVVLDYGDVVMHTQIHGIGGRATSGLLGVLFDVMGDARATESRFALAADGTEVARVSVRKGPISLNQTVTVRPNGTVEKGIPRERPDLRALEKLLLRKVSLRYK